MIGLGIVMLALAVTWLSRPADRPGDRDAHPKGWPTPLAASAGMPGALSDAPLAAFLDKQGALAARPVILAMGWIVVISVAGAALGGRSVRACLPGACLLAALACLAFVLASQKVVKYDNLEYPLWALAVGLLVGNTVGVPRWLAPAVGGEFFIKIGLVIFGAEVLLPGCWSGRPSPDTWPCWRRAGSTPRRCTTPSSSGCRCGRRGSRSG